MICLPFQQTYQPMICLMRVRCSRPSAYRQKELHLSWSDCIFSVKHLVIEITTGVAQFSLTHSKLCRRCSAHPWELWCVPWKIQNYKAGAQCQIGVNAYFQCTNLTHLTLYTARTHTYRSTASQHDFRAYIDFTLVLKGMLLPYCCVYHAIFSKDLSQLACVTVTGPAMPVSVAETGPAFSLALPCLTHQI